MKIKRRSLINLIFMFIIIFTGMSISRAENMKKLPMENNYHKLDIVDANKDSFAIKIKNINNKSLEDISLDTIKIENGKLDTHSQGINDLQVNDEIEVNGKYLSSNDKVNDKDIEKLFESRKKEIVKENSTQNTNSILVVLLAGVSVSALVFAFLYKKLKKTAKIAISVASLALIALSIFLALPSKKYYTKFDTIKFNYTDKDGNAKKFYGLLNYKIERDSDKNKSNNTESFENNVAMKEEVKNRTEDVDFRTVEETSDQLDVVVKGDDGKYRLNTEVTEGKKGKKTFEELYNVTIKDNKVVSRDKRSETLIKETRPEDKVIVTGTRPVKLKEKIDFEKVYKSDISAEVGSSKVDESVKAKEGQKTTVYTYNTETNKMEKNETVDKPTNEIVLVGVIKYVKEDVDFKEEIIKNPELPDTHKKIMQEGKKGQITKIYQLAFDAKTGKVIEDLKKAKLLKEDVTQPTSQIVEVGTKHVEVNEFGLTKEQEDYLNAYESRFSVANRNKLNNLRSRNMLNSLYQNSVLDKVAKKRNLDNINNNKFAHEYTKNGVYYSAKQDASNLGYAYPRTVGENISITEFHVKNLKQIEEILGSPESYAEEIIHNYYEDPGSENLSKGHRKAVLTPFWREVGVDLEIRAVKQDNSSYKVKVHGAQIFGVGRVMESNEDVDMFNYYRAFYQTDTKHFVPTRGLASYEAYLQRDSLLQYFTSPSEARAFRKKSISENEAFKKAISSGEADLSKLKNYEEHKKFYENMKANNIVYR